MGYNASESVVVTTDGSGAATAYSAGYNGLVHSIVYTPSGTVPYSDNVVVTITAETSGVAIWSETIADGDIPGGLTRYPRAATHTVLGAAALYAAAGVAVLDHIALASERIKIVIASGGNAKVGTFTFVLRDCSPHSASSASVGAVA